jgi:alkyldihydroxyacetonephosphate synthase
MSQDRSKLRWNGWGWAAHKDDIAEREDIWRWLAAELGMPALLATPARPLEELTLPAGRLSPQDRAELETIVGADQVRDSAYERAFHALGRSYHDLLRLRAGDLSSAPDAVVYPRSTDEVLQVLALANKKHIAVLPYGGGSGAVGWSNCKRGDYEAVIAIDLSDMDRVTAIDPISSTATVEAGIYGPALENALKAKGLTLGHFPQSFEFSTLGGWIVQRGAGQAASRYGRADDWLLSAKLATPLGLVATGDFPTSAAGPQLKDIVTGSEGVFGIVSEAVLRVRPLPQVCDYRGTLFRDFRGGLEAMRLALQTECAVSVLQLSDAEETRFLRAYDGVGTIPNLLQRLGDAYRKLRGFSGKACLMIAGFEGETRSVALARKRFSAIAARRGMPAGSGAGENWRKSRYRLPYLRDVLLERGVGVEILETAASWSKLEQLHAAVHMAIEDAVRETVPREGARGVVMCRAGHATTNGASLTFTIVFPRRLEGEIAQWQKIKTAASEAIVAHGGTISHHHGIGRDHLPWMEQEKGTLGLEVLRGIKKALDPEGIMNPGKLLP